MAHKQCTSCGSKRPRYTTDKKTTTKGTQAQQRDRFCNRCAWERGIVKMPTHLKPLFGY